MTKKTMLESLGTLMRHAPPAGPGPSGPRPQPSIGDPDVRPFISQQNLQGVDLFRFTFRDWQQNIIRALRNNQNIYVVASPGAGKTAPVAFYWAERILGVNPSMFQQQLAERQVVELFDTIYNLIRNPEHGPKILYLCPVRQLVYNIQKEFKEYLSQIILHAIKIIYRIDSPVNVGRIRDLMSLIGNYGRDFRPLYNERNNLLGQYQYHINQNNEQRANQFAQQIQQLDNQLNEQFATAISNFIDQRLLHIKTQVDSPPRHTPLITVAIYESGLDIFNNLRNDNLKAVIIDEAHMLQEREDDLRSRAPQIVERIYPIIKGIRNLNECRLILLSGTINPNSAINLRNFIRECLGVNLNIVTAEGSRNPSETQVIPMDDLKSDTKLVDIIANPRDESNAIIVFSKKKILKLAHMALEKKGATRLTAQQVDRGDAQSPRRGGLGIDLSQLDPQRPDRRFQVDRERLMDRINQVPGAGQIDDDFLLKCVLSGFGYIFRQDDDSMSDDEKRTAGRNQRIVAELFSQGKINTILATDAIGIGINMKIKNMYVPKAKKFDGQREVELPVSDASQLYNRVGRMAFNVSNIYTPEASVDNIVNAISASNHQYEDRSVVISNIKQLCGKYLPGAAPLWYRAMVNLPGRSSEMDTSFHINV